MADFPSSGSAIEPGDVTSRRSLIAGTVGVAALLVSGCSVENPTSADKAPKSAAELAPDVTVAIRALAEIRAVRAAVSRTASRYPPLRPDLAPLVRMHRAHEASLVDAVPERARPTANPRRTSSRASVRWRCASSRRGSSGCTTRSPACPCGPRAVTSPGCWPAWEQGSPSDSMVWPS